VLLLKALTGKHICIVHPHTIATDVRLEKTLHMLAAAGAQLTLACVADMNKDSGTLAELAHIWRIDRGPRYFPSSKHPVRILRVAYNLCIANPIQFVQRKVIYANDPLRGMAQLIAEKNFDAVHFINYSTSRTALRLRKLSAVPLVYESYECWPKNLRRLQDRSIAPWNSFARWRTYEASCAKVAQALITVSEPIQKVYAELAPTTPSTLVYNVALASSLQPSAVQRPLRFYLQSFLRSHYGIETVMQAFAKVSGNYSLTIQGPSYQKGYLDQLQSLSDTLNLADKLTFADPCSNEEAVTAANNHDVGLLFLPAQIDGRTNYNGKWSLPNKLFVYASAGLAMMYSNFQETTKEIVAGHDCAVFVDGDNTDAIAGAIQKLIDNPSLVAEMKANSHEWAQSYTMKTEGEKLANLYHDVLAQN